MGWEVHVVDVVVLFSVHLHKGISTYQGKGQCSQGTGYQEKISPNWEAEGELPCQAAGNDEQPEMSNQEQCLSYRVPQTESIYFTQKFMNHLHNFA